MPKTSKEEFGCHGNIRRAGSSCRIADCINEKKPTFAIREQRRLWPDCAHIAIRSSDSSLPLYCFRLTPKAQARLRKCAAWPGLSLFVDSECWSFSQLTPISDYVAVWLWVCRGRMFLRASCFKAIQSCLI